MSKRKPFLFNQNLITNGMCTIQWWRVGRGEEREGRKVEGRGGKERKRRRDIP